MQNDLRKTGQKQYVCMRNNMHKLRPEIVDYSIWLKKEVSGKLRTTTKIKERTSFAPYLAAVLAQVSLMARRWSVCSNRLRTSTANCFGTTFVSSLV